MSTRHLFALLFTLLTVSQMGCCCLRGTGCGASCGYGGQVYDDCCSASCGVADPCCDDGCCGDGCCGECASCGVADVSCGCPEPSCCCPDPACGCPDGCGNGVGCGSRVGGGCRLLQRIRAALNRNCAGCASGPAYYGEWSDTPPCACETCDQFGNYTGGGFPNDGYAGSTYDSPHGRRARMARRHMQDGDELRFNDRDNQTLYR